jgi:hypothetical protein
MGTVTLDDVRAGAAPNLYPRHALVGCTDALVLFAAAFHGQQDAVWMAEAGVVATCVDTDQVKLAEMKDAYPTDWAYETADAFEFAIAAANWRWDVVSLDPPSNLFGRCAKLLPIWCRLARRVVILGTGKDTVIDEPEGWKVSACVRRSNFLGGVYWTVLEPC